MIFSFWAIISSFILQLSIYVRIENQTVLDSEEIADGIIIDYDEHEKIVGVELLGIKTIQPENLALLIPLLPESLKDQIQAILPQKRSSIL